MKHERESNKETLRARAERLATELKPDGRYSSASIQDLIHELMVHQAELEMQNEELRSAQIELKESKDRYFDLYDSAPISYITLDQYSMITEVNLTGASMLGVKRYRLIGRPFWKFIAAEDRDKYYEHIENARASRIKQSCEIRLIPGGGGEIYIFMESLPKEDPEGNVTGFRSVLHDLTDRRSMEALRESESRERARAAELQAIMEAVPGIIFIAHDPECKKMSVNRSTYDLLRVPPQANVSKSATDGEKPMNFRAMKDGVEIPPEELPVQKAARGCEVRDYELDIMFGDGEVFTIFGNASPVFDEHGNPQRAVGAFVDVTERKRVEKELSKYRTHLEKLVHERTMELEEKNRQLKEEMIERVKAEEEKRKIEAQLAQGQRVEALDRFAGGIAHDLNNILYPIIINIEELLAEEPPDSFRRDILDQTMRAAFRQRDLVKKILSFGRRNELALEPLRIVPLIEETLDFLRSTIPSTIEIRQRIQAPSDIIMGDSTQIQQVLMNLCQNAADAFVSRKGTIEVSLTDTRLEPDHGRREIPPGDYLELSVRDTGSGIEPDVIDHIFEPFYTTKEVGKGTGMGLSVVHGIVRSHGGAITVRSRAGEGTVFTVYLPIYSGEAHASSSSHEMKPVVEGREKILLVDDEAIVLSSLQRVLKNCGYRVVAMMDGAEALRLFESEPYEFDLVITDLTMPKLTGLELARRVLNIRPGFPVILSTGYNDAINEQEASSLGIRELLIKPTDSKELKRIVQHALEC